VPLVDLFPFLESFLPEAAVLWQAPRSTWQKSDLWTQSDLNGREYPLQATAVKAGKRRFLVIESAELLYHEQRAVVQYAHEARLQYEKAAQLTRSLAEANEQLEVRNREVERATRAKSEFLAAMSHEIRTPMNAILGMAELLWETPLSSEQRQYVQIFRRAGNHLLNLINDILDLSKVEAGHIQLERIPFDLWEVLEKAVQLTALRAHQKDLELTCRLMPDVPAAVVGDPDRLRQVLVNLLGNAIKFTERGEVTLLVEIDPEGAERGFLRFSIVDTGIGIPQDKLELIFESFTQADASITRKYGGTGLGLAICKHLVELMGGRIWAESQVGAGSRFSFTARFDLALDAPATPPPPDLRREKVLVVDDNATHRLAVREILSSWGASVAEAGRGELAMAELARALAEGAPYTLALLDSRMPGMDGLQVAEQIHRNPRLSRSTILMLTTDRATDLARHDEVRMSACLTKPVTRSDLAECLRTALAAPASPMPPARPATAPARSLAQTPLRILLADDSEDNRFLIRAYLKNTGCLLDEAANGEIALQKFVAGRYDLVLIDVEMPVMDGYSATRAMRAWERDQRRQPAPILALTAHALKEQAQSSLNAGCNAHLTKPIGKDTLLEAIDRYAARDAGPAQRVQVRVENGLRDIVPGFLDNRRNDVARLYSALEASDFEAIRQLGHKMKGTGAGYGFPLITEIGSDLEQAAQTPDPARVRKRVEELDRFLENVTLEFE
jgi:signal transduction histidine kinase/DNA-binding response OmpR family regulator